MLDYPALAALAVVVREGSFERAAQSLHVTPSAVSQRIRQLEERMGCALVLREQPCRPTEAGRRLCQHLDRVGLLEQELQGLLPALAQAPSLIFSPKDELQDRWVQRQFGHPVALPRHTLPSPQAFLTASLAGMGWGLQIESQAAPHLADGRLVDLRPGTPLDVPLYWQHARVASGLLEGLSRAMLDAAQRVLRPA
ncbi:MAG TPA: LysR family transcriptional regulator [Burkholderiaceae bacterium]|nr:LysR family transcriptional regulator [Burkholderiaceae bacterium]HMX09357.1 LysR family transcriptional regulator [Burkholderiaceae bacterium]HNB43521.1 LysR family transcriptional regulator [Burkholderiaceae bacterium]HNG78073.1 LysR family transcriptional regulator [Burkholderiaceae bacterium]